MSKDRQDQRVGEGGQAIQAGNDVIIHQGVSAMHIAEILAVNARMIEQYRYEAQAEAEIRFKIIEEKIQQKFATDEANSEAFRQPDFQFAVRGAQASFVRSGEEAIGDTLVSMLAQRSQVAGRDITGLVLDEAIEVSGKLSKPQLAFLSVAFLLLRAKFSASSANHLSKQFGELLGPIIDDLPTGQTTASYLAGLGCMQFETIINRNIVDLLIANYGFLLNDGFKKSEFMNVLGLDLGVIDAKFTPEQLWSKLVRGVDGQFTGLSRASFITSVPSYTAEDDERRFIFNQQSEVEFKPVLDANVSNEQLRESLLALAKSKYWREERIMDQLRSEIPSIDRMKVAFLEGGLSQSSLTAKGVAIAHSYLTHVSPSFSAPLSIWIN